MNQRPEGQRAKYGGEGKKNVKVNFPKLAGKNLHKSNARMLPTKKAGPPPPHDVNRDSGTDRANGGFGDLD
jgi:hypothetical protein